MAKKQLKKDNQQRGETCLKVYQGLANAFLSEKHKEVYDCSSEDLLEYMNENDLWADFSIYLIAHLTDLFSDNVYLERARINFEKNFLPPTRKVLIEKSYNEPQI